MTTARPFAISCLTGPSQPQVIKRFLVQAKKEIQEKILNEIGVQWDFPDPTGKGGTSTTANTGRNILYHSMHLVIGMISTCIPGR